MTRKKADLAPERRKNAVQCPESKRKAEKTASLHRQPDSSTPFATDSVELIKQSSESLAGRIEHVSLSPFSVAELGADKIARLWLREVSP